MPQATLTVKALTTKVRHEEQDYALVDEVSFELYAGETLALLGESGCGKSMTALSLLGLSPKPATYIDSGSVLFEEQDLLAKSEQAMRQVRGRKISMIFQEPMTSLNPVMTIAEQIAEVLVQNNCAKEDLKKNTIEALESVGIPDAKNRLHDYPHQFSGGMKQRVMIALALATQPDVLIADEPTTALDVTIQAQVLNLLKELQMKSGMAIILITHDLGVVQQMADRVAVMYAGQIVEQSSCDAFFKQPVHPYSKALFNAIPSLNNREEHLSVIQGFVPSLQQTFDRCRFHNRCDFANEQCLGLIHTQTLDDGRLVRCVHPFEQNKSKAAEKPHLKRDIELKTALQVSNVKTHFPIRKGLLKTIKGYVYAVDGVDLSINKGQTLALVGESGCGKTTVGKSILQMINEAQGDVIFDQSTINLETSKPSKQFYQQAQFIFQDPFSSMNPRMTVKQIVAEGLIGVHGLKGEVLTQKVKQLLAQVGIDEAAIDRYPHEFSGGQRQRICIARALAVEPSFIVCDEPTSALDVSVQAQILNLLKNLQYKKQLSYLFITHNISVVSWLADSVAVMYLGRIVEMGTVEQILQFAKHPYTKALLAAVPQINNDLSATYLSLKGELPSPINPPRGCYFHPRCPDSTDQCKHTYPSKTIHEGHEVYCHLYSA